MTRTLALVGTFVSLAAFGGGQTILFTNDTHAHIDDGKITFAQIAAERERLAAAGEEPILVDCGDIVQGTAFGKIDRGASVIEIMNAAGYQVGTLGNHEFDYGLPAAIRRAKEDCRFAVVACNFWRTNVVAGCLEYPLPAYTVVTTATARVAFVGIATPESITSSAPKNFMDPTCSYFLYGFDGGADGKPLYDRVQRTVNEAAKAAEAVIVVSHLGIGASAGPWRSVDVIRNTTNFIALLDGHSHSMVDSTVLNAAGVPVRHLQTGSYLKRLGVLRLADGKVRDVSFLGSLTATNATVQALERDLIGRVSAWLGKKLAVADVPMFRYLENRMICSETNLGDFIADAYYWYANTHTEGGCDMAFSNYAGLRENVTAGDFSLRTANDVCPFGNGICRLEATGAQIRDALEWGARLMPDYVGGLLHCAGVRYSVATSLVSSVKSEGGIWTEGPAEGAYRVHDIEVYDRATHGFVPLDLARTYRVAGIDYTLLNFGEGYRMLVGCKVLEPSLGTDYLIVADYAKAFRKGADGWPHLNSANSPLVALPGYPIDYATRGGAGRIRPTE